MTNIYSVSSSAVNSIKPHAESYPYVGQQCHSGPLASIPMFDNFSSIDPELLGMSSCKPAPLPSPPINRRSSHSLGVDVGAASQYGAYQQQGHYPAAPLSAPYALPSQAGYTSVQPKYIQGESAIGMKRVGTYPQPNTRITSGHHMNFYQSNNSSANTCSPAERQRIRAEVAANRVPMEHASVMQPYIPPTDPSHMAAVNGQYQALQVQQQQQPPRQVVYQPQQQQQQQQHRSVQIMGWQPSNSLTPPSHYPAQFQGQNQSQGPLGSASMMTNAPLNNVHPPATSFHPNHPMSRVSSASIPGPQHRVHPPPHSGLPVHQQQRPIASMPSGTPAGRQARKASTTAAKAKPRPSPGGRKKNMPVSGIQEHGGIFFANYTPNDGQTLLKGVAPSGSQAKRKREEASAALLLSIPMGQVSSGSDISGDEDSASKRSRSSVSSQPQ